MDGGAGGPVRPVVPRLRTMSDVNGALRQLFENRGGRHPIGPSAPLAARTQRTQFAHCTRSGTRNRDHSMNE